MAIDLSLISQKAEQFREYMAQFDDMFVDRAWANRLIMYALLTREHVLLFGPPGTSKTQICDAVFDGIDGATSFRTEVSGFTGEDGILGPYNVKRLREDGVLEHNTTNMLPEAQFARIGEFLDANGPLLRALLGAMNERRMLRGSQNIKMPLMSVYLDTNKDPALYLKKNPDAWAVIDRVMFLEKLEYLDSSDKVEEMVTRYQRGASQRAKKRIDVEVIETLSGLIVNPPGLITDTSIIKTYAAIVAEYRNRRRQMTDEEKALFILPEISDRRVNKASMILEAEAILNGRLNVVVDDILAAGVSLCTSKAELALWHNVAEPFIAEHKKRSAAQLSSAQGMALKAIAERLDKEVLGAAPAAPTADLARTLHILSQQFGAISPSTPEVATLHEEVQGKFKQALANVKERTLHESGLDSISF